MQKTDKPSKSDIQGATHKYKTSKNIKHTENITQGKQIYERIDKSKQIYTNREWAKLNKKYIIKVLATY